MGAPKLSGGSPGGFPGGGSAELAFGDDPLVAVGDAADAVLVAHLLRRQQAHDLIGAAGGGAVVGARGEIEGLADVEFVGLHRNAGLGLMRRERDASLSRPSLGTSVWPMP